MGIDYNSSVVIGYNISVSEFMKFFTLQWRDEIVKEEKRFSEKTGKPIKPIKVVEQIGRYDIYFDGKQLDIEGLEIESDSFDDNDHFFPCEELLEVVAKALDCNVELHGDFYSSYYNIAVSSNKVKNQNVDGAWGRSTNSFIAFDNIMSAKEDTCRIGEAAKARGVDLGEPGIHSFLDIT